MLNLLHVGHLHPLARHIGCQIMNSHHTFISPPHYTFPSPPKLKWSTEKSSHIILTIISRENKVLDMDRTSVLWNMITPRIQVIICSRSIIILKRSCTLIMLSENFF